MEVRRASYLQYLLVLGAQAGEGSHLTTYFPTDLKLEGLGRMEKDSPGVSLLPLPILS